MKRVRAWGDEVRAERIWERRKELCTLQLLPREKLISVLHTEMSWGAAARSLTESRQRQKLQSVKKTESIWQPHVFVLPSQRRSWVKNHSGYFSGLMSLPHYIHDTDWFPENPSTTKPSELCIAAISNASNSSKSCTEAETSHFEKEGN